MKKARPHIAQPIFVPLVERKPSLDLLQRHIQTEYRRCKIAAENTIDGAERTLRVLKDALANNDLATLARVVEGFNPQLAARFEALLELVAATASQADLKDPL